MEASELRQQLKELQIYSHRKVTELFAGNYKSAFKGAGLEVKNIREYVPGDEVKYIDWNTSARQGKLYVKEYQETRELATMLLIDVSASMNFGSGRYLKREILLQTAAVLLYSALKNNDMMGAVVFADTVKAYVPLRKGQAQMWRILYELLHTLERNAYARTDTKKALEFFNRIVKKQAITFMMVDEFSEDVSKAVRAAQARHDFVVVNIYDDFERLPGGVGLVWIEDPETGEQELVNFDDPGVRQRYGEMQSQKLEEFYLMLKRQGIDVVDLNTDMDVYTELLLFFKRRQLRY